MAAIRSARFPVLLSSSLRNLTAVQSLLFAPRGRSITSSARVAKYDLNGAVEQVLKVTEEPLPVLGPRDVLIKMLAAPMNPADFNMIEGVYNIRPSLPAYGGNEGVAVVVDKGSEVTSLAVNDWVLPANPGFGTWRTHAVCNEDVLIPVDNDIPVEYAATVAINPCTAFRMLQDFVKLKPGDVIIQNGANSAVGIAVIQLARHMGVKTINMIRDRPDLLSVTERLKGWGADVVVTEETASSAAMAKIVQQVGRPPVLGLNCVGGKSAVEVTRLLADRAPMVTYGGMSRQPVTVPTGKLIFNDISLRGFWLSRWTSEHSKEDRQAMIKSLTDLMRQGKLKALFEKMPFSNFQTAVSRAREQFRNHKVVLVFDDQHLADAATPTTAAAADANTDSASTQAK